ncbi:MAG TPA: phage tail sheath subtilisin-like domain-containing protein [Thermoanaerobaculia bacterium]|nr:phage tail sheath subtilisin-like domain-containing protein [Thermoanaerobaculia bacterium]
MTLTRPLPGIRFEAKARPLNDVLPRMDIPVFAGFAATGPLHLPVAIEDPGGLMMIFGGEVELPRPFGAREPRYAHLVPAVREFFRNGGRRCWVIRVADPETAVANSFLVPGLADAVLRNPVQAWARSEGSWSDSLRIRTNLVPVPLQFETFDLNGPRLDLRIASTRDVTAGDLLRLTWSPTVALYLFVTSIEYPEPRLARIAGTPHWATLPAPLALPPGNPAVERLTFDLTARRENEAPLRLGGLGFAPAHPRYFGALPTDALLFADEPEDGWPELWRDARTPRFPLAAELDETFYLPIGMTALFSAEAEPEKVSGTELVRDGLASFSADLFLDPHLRDTKVRDLLGQANALRYQAGFALTGIHAALGIEEATMLSVPDAVHRGWVEDSGGGIASPLASSPLEHPELFRCWESVSHGTDGTDETNGTDGGAKRNFFVDCTALDPIAAPFLSATEPDGGTYDVTWTPLDGRLDELQEATLPDLSDAATVSIGSSGTFAFIGRPAGDYFYRVRRLLGSRTSEWSNGVAVRVGSISGFVSLDDDDGDDPHLVTVHEAMLRMCAARADMVALLSLPRHYDERRAITHSTALMTSLESQALSYGALWHPWLIGRDDDAGPLRATPPDGATAGVMAQRAISRGAWVAPANEPLRGVVALTPDIALQARQALQDAAVNLIRRDPAGFLCLDADTLSGDEDVRALNVRRLLILVRRAALLTGNDYAFEPHSITLRNTIKRGFESMLSTMYLRGAFAGRSAKSAYQVVTDETVNTPQSTDQGRFIAELKIAPSRPLSFLTIRLLQRGEASTAEEVR